VQGKINRGNSALNETQSTNPASDRTSPLVHSPPDYLTEGPMSCSCQLSNSASHFITFCVSHRRRKMYCGHASLCVCLSTAVRPHYCTDRDVTWGHGRGCPLVVHYWVDLQSVHRLRCYGNITRILVYAGCCVRC